MSIQPLPSPRPGSFRWKRYDGLAQRQPHNNSRKQQQHNHAAAHEGGDRNDDGTTTDSLRQRHRSQAADAASASKDGSSSSSTPPAPSSSRTWSMWVRESVYTPLGLTDAAMAEDAAAMPALVLVHGLVVSGTYLEPLGACLAPYFRVYIPDLPGYGQSASCVPDPAEVLSIPAQADLLADWLRHAGLVGPSAVGAHGPPIFFGNSMGNNVISELARRHPEAVGACVLQGCIRDKAEQSAVSQAVHFLLNGRNEPLNHGWTTVNDWQSAGYRRVFRSWQVLREHSIEAALSEVHQPVLFLTAELDNISDLSWNARLQKRATQGRASLLVLLDQPHTCAFTAPRICAELVRDWAAAAIDARREHLAHATGEEPAASITVPAPSHWLEQRPSLTSDLPAFLGEALGLVLPPFLLLAVVLLRYPIVSWSTLLLSWLLSGVLASLWRYWHRCSLLPWCREHDVPAWPCSATPIPVPRVADFDSATVFLRATALAVRGHDCPFLGRDEFILQRPLGWLLNTVPERARLLAYALTGAMESSWPFVVRRVVDGAAAAKAIVEHYPVNRTYPAIAIGSSNGALAHVSAAMRVPWLPHTLMFGVAHGRGIRHERAPFAGLSASQNRKILDMSAEMHFLTSTARAVLDRNPDWELHHMADPNQDSLMVQWMSYFRLKQRVLHPEYRKFILKHLQPGGTILLSHCLLRWPSVEVGERHFFQPGAYGGLTPEQYRIPNRTVDQFIRREVLRQSELEVLRERPESEWLHWNAPEVTCTTPEAEWGTPDTYRASVEEFAQEHGFKVMVLEHQDPQHLAPPVAELFRQWQAHDRREALLRGNKAQGRDGETDAEEAHKGGSADSGVIEMRTPEDLQLVPHAAISSDVAAAPQSDCRLSLRDHQLVMSQFIQMDPWWVLRVGGIPFWTVFSVESSHRALHSYLSRSKHAGRPFRSACASLFSHGTLSVGLATVHQWQATLSSPRLLTHPRQSFHEEAANSSVVQVQDDSSGGLLLGVMDSLFPRDFQSLMHMHDRMAGVGRQRYAMPLWQRQCMQVQHIAHAFRHAGINAAHL